MTLELFDASESTRSWREDFCEGAAVLRGFALVRAPELLAAISEVSSQAPFRCMVTPGGFRMSVAMTNCGAYGWVTDKSGYRYDAADPESGNVWPAMPAAFAELARAAAASAGVEGFKSVGIKPKGFKPDACLINRYEPGSRLSLHQDKDERDYSHPIVSVSLGLPAVFLFGGLRREDKTQRIPLAHGDVVVWGGPARLRYHGVAPLKDGNHPLLGACRINLTLRRAA